MFGAGPIGLAVVGELRSRGHAVRVATRTQRTELPADVSRAVGDAMDPAWAIEAAVSASVVYQCLNPPYHQWPQLFPTLQRNVTRAAQAADATLVVMDNLYGYGPTGGLPLTEDLPHAATGAKGRTRAAMARELLAAHAAGEVRATIGRASDYFGPRALVSAMGERVFYPLLAGKKAQIIGNPDTQHSYAYVPDIARGLVALGERDEALGEVWHLPHSEAITTREFVRRAAAALGVNAGLQSLPKPLARLIGLFNRDVRELIELWYEFDEPFVVDDSKFRGAFGVLPTPLDDAIGATVEWFRAHPRAG